MPATAMLPKEYNPVLSRPSTRISLVAVFTGVSLGTNYALSFIPNVKVMDALVFIAAFLFGLEVGVGVAFFSRLIYGYVNPWGQVGMELLAFLILGECFYALAGTIVRRAYLAKETPTGPEGYQRWTREGFVFGLAGLISTFAYDVLTNFASYAFTTTSLFNALLVGMATGAVFGIIHEVSNLILFATIAPITILSANRFMINSR